MSSASWNFVTKSLVIADHICGMPFSGALLFSQHVARLRIFSGLAYREREVHTLVGAAQTSSLVSPCSKVIKLAYSSHLDVWIMDIIATKAWNGYVCNFSINALNYQ